MKRESGWGPATLGDIVSRSTRKAKLVMYSKITEEYNNLEHLKCPSPLSPESSIH